MTALSLRANSTIYPVMPYNRSQPKRSSPHTGDVLSGMSPLPPFVASALSLGGRTLMEAALSPLDDLLDRLHEQGICGCSGCRFALVQWDKGSSSKCLDGKGYWIAVVLPSGRAEAHGQTLDEAARNFIVLNLVRDPVVVVEAEWARLKALG